MQRFLIFLIPLILIACGANESIAPTITAIPSPLVFNPTPQADATPTADSAPTQSLLVNAVDFPNVENYQWEPMLTSQLQRPVDINSALGVLYIVEKKGKIRVMENNQLLDIPFLDITDRVDDSGNEMGLLGLAFHPDYATNHFFYVNYTGAEGNTYISRFQADAPTSEKVLLMIEQPYANHNGGALAFGADGYLYAGLGDGGLAGDPHGNGQNTNALLGKILRVDVNNGDPYAIPSDNPFGNEVWAVGLRNPWRISFDQANGDLWIGDVGQGDWEEVDYLPAGSAAGANFGWSIMEGNHGYYGAAQPDLILPVAEYSHNDGGCSVTGGYVYRGAMPEWNGVYFYGDYCLGTIWGLMLKDGVWQNQTLFETGERITSFGQDEAGEIYFVSDGGSLYKLVKR